MSPSIWAASWQSQQNYLCGQAKTRLSLGICPVWSESSLSAGRKLGSLATHWPHSEDWSDRADAQADLSLRSAHISFCCFCHEAAHTILCLQSFNLFKVIQTLLWPWKWGKGHQHYQLFSLSQAYHINLLQSIHEVGKHGTEQALFFLLKFGNWSRHLMTLKTSLRSSKPNQICMKLQDTPGIHEIISGIMRYHADNHLFAH